MPESKEQQTIKNIVAAISQEAYAHGANRTGDSRVSPRWAVELQSLITQARIDELMDISGSSSVRRKDSTAKTVKERISELKYGSK